MNVIVIRSLAMSEEQLSALLAKLKEDRVLMEKLKRTEDLGAAVKIAMEAGFDVSKEDWLTYQTKHQSIELSDEELETVAGGKESADCKSKWPCFNEIF